MLTRSLLACSFALLASAVLTACSSAPSQSASGAPAVSAEVSFTCLWWSEAQMEGLNPNAPPPKNTEVKLTKWEYSDPVGVPHPDTVTVLITLANSGSRTLSDLDVEIAGEWKNGPLRDAAKSVWSRSALMQKFQDVSVEPAGRKILRVPVDFKGTMESLAKQHRWPYRFRATVSVHAHGSAQPLAQAQAELPIRPGN
jgi:hypothetical protein